MCDYIHDKFPLATFREADAIVQLNLKYTHANKELQTLSALTAILGHYEEISFMFHMLLRKTV